MSTGLISEFIVSRQCIAKASRKAFPYLVVLLNTCRDKLKENSWDQDTFTTQTNPVYMQMQGVNKLIIDSAYETKFDLNVLIAKVRGVSTSFADVITITFNEIKTKEEKTAMQIHSVKDNISCCINKASSLLRNDVYHVEVIFYEYAFQGIPDIIHVSGCTSKSTVDLLLMHLLIGCPRLSLKSNPHFFDKKRIHSTGVQPLAARLFSEELGEIGGSINKISAPLQLYCVTDQPPYILLRMCSQRVFTNLWLIHGVIGDVNVYKTYLKEINGQIVSSSDMVITKIFMDKKVLRVTKNLDGSVGGQKIDLPTSWGGLLDDIYAEGRSVRSWTIEASQSSQTAETTSTGHPGPTIYTQLQNESKQTLVGTASSDSVLKTKAVVGPIVASSPAKSMSPNTPHLLNTSHDGVDISHTIDAMLGTTITAEGQYDCQPNPLPYAQCPLTSGKENMDPSGRSSPTSLHNACQLQDVMHSLDPPGRESRCDTPAKCADASLTNSERITVSNPHAPGGGEATQYVSQTTVQATGQFSSLKSVSQRPPKRRKWYEPILKYFGGKTP